MKTVVILAQGDFPTSERCLQMMWEADVLLCCDGAAAKAVAAGFEPDEIVGDLDSLDTDFRERYASRLFHDRDQECNDQTKAFRRALSLQPDRIVILGATGRREDHTLGNISLLADYTAALAKDEIDCHIEMWSDYGHFEVIRDSATLPSHPGQEISLFSFDPTLKVHAEGLRYPTDAVVFDTLWKATLNVAESSTFTLTLSHPSSLLIYWAE